MGKKCTAMFNSLFIYLPYMCKGTSIVMCISEGTCVQRCLVFITVYCKIIFGEYYFVFILKSNRFEYTVLRKMG